MCNCQSWSYGLKPCNASTCPGAQGRCEMWRWNECWSNNLLPSCPLLAPVSEISPVGFALESGWQQAQVLVVLQDFSWSMFMNRHSSRPCHGPRNRFSGWWIQRWCRSANWRVICKSHCQMRQTREVRRMKNEVSTYTVVCPGSQSSAAMSEEM